MSGKVHKTRQLGYQLKGSEAFRKSGVKFATYSGASGWFTETLDSSGHRVSQLGKGLSDIGGPFAHAKRVVANSPQTVNVTDSFGNHLIGEANVCSVVDLAGERAAQDTLITSFTDGDLNAFGTTAIARCNPDNPNAPLATFLGELHEGFPRASVDTWQSRTRKFRALGSDYLNVEFGWEPFVADIRSLANSVVHSHKVIQQYHRDQNKPIRRRYSFPEEITSTELAESGVKSPYPLTGSMFHGNGGTRHRTRRVTIKKWFSGEFVVPSVVGNSQLDRFHRQYNDAQHLLGVGLTPDVVWELTPWSWAIDWYSNVGDVLTNVRAFMFDGMVMPYGYIMAESKVETTWSLEIPGYWIDGTDFQGAVTLTSVIQQRKPAFPFGFGIENAHLSARQIAILAALGIVLVL